MGKWVIIIFIAIALFQSSEQFGSRHFSSRIDYKAAIGANFTQVIAAHDAIPEFALVQRKIRSFIILRQLEEHNRLSNQKSIDQWREARHRANQIMPLFVIWLPQIHVFDRRLGELSATLHEAIHSSDLTKEECQRLGECRTIVAAMRQELRATCRVIENPDLDVPTNTEFYDPDWVGKMKQLADLLEVRMP